MSPWFPVLMCGLRMTCSCTHRESGEQVYEHLSSQGAFPPAQEGSQSLSEDFGDAIHIHIPREPQLHTQTP